MKSRLLEDDAFLRVPQDFHSHGSGLGSEESQFWSRGPRPEVTCSHQGGQAALAEPPSYSGLSTKLLEDAACHPRARRLSFKGRHFFKCHVVKQVTQCYPEQSIPLRPLDLKASGCSAQLLSPEAKPPRPHVEGPACP